MLLVSILFWVIFGGLAGLAASKIMGEDQNVNGWMNVAVGVIGAVIGGLVFSFLGGTGITGFNIYSFIVAILGSIILLWIAKVIRA